MHHPREAIIDGVQFVLIREDLLEEVKDVLSDYRHSTNEDGDSFNNDEVIALIDKLGAL